jgi:Zn-finger nucleic acid-binding protein
MVIQCPACQASYDVSTYEPGQRLRCHCGQVLIRPAISPKVHIAKSIHCASCGGNLEQGRPNCPYCNALIDLTHARMTAYCAACLSMSKEGASFCSGCGKTLVTKVEHPAETTQSCPRCTILMRRRTLGEYSPLECPMCCGLFVEEDILDNLIHDHKEQGSIASSNPGTKPAQASLPNGAVVYLKCPQCETMMNRVNYGRISGVIIDHCRRHGYWLDNGELEKIARFVASGGLDKKKAIEMEEQRQTLSRLSQTTPVAAQWEDENETSPWGNHSFKGFGQFIETVFRLLK